MDFDDGAYSVAVVFGCYKDSIVLLVHHEASEHLYSNTAPECNCFVTKSVLENLKYATW